jgi:hypothetical protein
MQNQKARIAILAFVFFPISRIANLANQYAKRKLLISDLKSDTLPCHRRVRVLTWADNQQLNGRIDHTAHVIGLNDIIQNNPHGEYFLS